MGLTESSSRKYTPFGALSSLAAVTYYSHDAYITFMTTVFCLFQ
jgi:hypothetical protein